MDQMLACLVDFIGETDFDSLGSAAVDRLVRHTVDTIGCGAGGFASAPARATRAVVSGIGGPLVASMYGENEKVLVEFAAFANATANRYLDFNDFGTSGHPSDMIPAILGMAEATGASGADAISGIFIAYEIATALAEAAPVQGGWDQGLYCSLGVAAGLAKMLRLPREQVANALSLAIVPSVPLKVTRFGQLSEWKAAAAAHATMTATLAVRLSRQGMSGPPEPFEGKDGLFERVWPPFEIQLGPRSDGTTAIERASLKSFPACYWGQVPIDLMTQLRSRVHAAEIESMEVSTCQTAWWAIGGGRGDATEKWRPATRETADHSMPYLLAVTLVDGKLDDESYDEARLTDPRLLSVMDKIRVTERADLTSRASRDQCPTELTIHLRNGSVATATADVPRGHHTNPMTNDEVKDKFEKLVSRVLAPSAVGGLGQRLWDLPELGDLEEVGQFFRSFDVR